MKIDGNTFAKTSAAWLPPNTRIFKTVFVLIFIPLPTAKSKYSELVQASVPSAQANVLSPSVDFKVIPPPSAPASLVVTPELERFNSMFLSSTLKVTVSTAVCVPPIVKFPSIIAFPPTCKVADGVAL